MNIQRATNKESQYYEKSDRHLVAVDCIIFGFQNEVLKILVVRRKVAPLIGQWSLIGSFLKSDEHIDDAAKRILQESTGLKDVFLEQLHCFGNKNRDPGARVISVAYTALIRLDESDESKVEAFGAKWIPLDQKPDLVVDHDEMMSLALKQLQRKARFYPIGFELLPKKFTLPQLLKLYQAIYQQKIDDRNFRKKILSLNILIKSDEKDKSFSKKGAFFYSFNKKKYERMVKEEGRFLLTLVK